MSPTGLETTASSRLSRCVACGGKVRLAADHAAMIPVAACPLCGLAIFATEDFDVFPPFVPPRIDREAAWNALAAERRFPPGDGPARIKDGRLLMTPFWMEKRKGAGLEGRVTFRSGADLTPVGIPSISPDGVIPRGLDLAARASTGDRMGRLPEAVRAIGALPVRVSLGPTDGHPGAALEALNKEPSGSAWSVVYYPIWAFHYALHEKEHHHAVDAVTGGTVGPAREVRWPVVAVAAATALIGAYLVLSPVLGAGAALPAWAAGLGVMRMSMRHYRG